MHGDLTNRDVTQRVSRHPERAYHPQIIRWKKSISSQGATVSQTTLKIANEFVWRLKHAGILPKIMGASLFPPDNVWCGYAPVIRNIGYDPWKFIRYQAAASMNFSVNVNGMQSSANASNTSGICLDTGVFVNTAYGFTSASGGMTCYLHTVVNDTLDRREMGESGPGDTGNQIIIRLLSQNNTYGSVYCPAAYSANAGFRGFLSLNRLTPANFKLYTANTTQPMKTLINANSDAGALEGYTTAVFGLALSTTPTYGAFSLCRFSFAAVHKGLTIDEVNVLYEAVTTARKKFGGGWV
jgi:hypothetical protein